jgi:hypothetical protein
MDKNKLQFNLTFTMNEIKLLQNLEWKLVDSSTEPSWSLVVPGSDPLNNLYSTDWSVTKFSISN